MVETIWEYGLEGKSKLIIDHTCIFCTLTPSRWSLLRLSLQHARPRIESCLRQGLVRIRCLGALLAGRAIAGRWVILQCQQPCSSGSTIPVVA